MNSTKSKILFICQANVGRSQMAEAFFNTLAKDKHAISAGVIDVRKKYNYKPTPMIYELMKEKGIDMPNAKIKVLTSKMTKDLAKIVVLCNKNMCPKFILEDKRTILSEVADPHDMTIESARKVRDQIEEIVIKLI